ncbi:MAG: hypothetical protein IPP74_12595 [Alphaproteobacteria bacterium]|nr:hypothetical protein [Alphaproteobacteria bacterium]
MSNSKIEALVSDEFLIDCIPDTIVIPALGAHTEQVIKPLEQATLDDLAFAAIALDDDLVAINSQLYALRALYHEARQKGALGNENIIDALSRNGIAQ